MVMLICVCTDMERFPKPTVKWIKQTKVFWKYAWYHLCRNKILSQNKTCLCAQIYACIWTQRKKLGRRHIHPLVVVTTCPMDVVQDGGGNNEKLSHFIHHIYCLDLFLQWEHICVLYICFKKNTWTGKLGLMSKSVNFWKRSMLYINVSQQCLSFHCAHFKGLLGFPF